MASAKIFFDSRATQTRSRFAQLVIPYYKREPGGNGREIAVQGQQFCFLLLLLLLFLNAIVSDGEFKISTCFHSKLLKLLK